MSVRVEVDGRVMYVTLDRPEVRNALDWDAWGTLSEAWQRLDKDDSLWLGVVTGTGDQSFCAGADLKTLPAEMKRRREANLPSDPPRAFIDDYCRKPVLCAVNGHALGLGLEIALACDVRIAADHATFGLPESTFGGLPGAGGTQRLPRVVGPGRALELMLTNRTLSAHEALQIGLVSSVVPAADLTEEIQRYVGRMTAIAPLSAQAIKRAVADGLEVSLAEGIRLEKSLSATLKASEDQVAGLAARKNKQPIVWRGR